METKICRKCGIEKPIEEFGLHRDRPIPRRVSRCRACRVSEQSERRLKKEYGITEADYQRLLHEQAGVCKLCKRPEIAAGKRLSIDHDHTTGKVRGLLCTNCNLGLGAFRDDATLMRYAAEYVEISHGIFG